MSVFEELYAVNVNEHTEPKNGLTYLSWSWAWAYFKKKYPTAVYEVWKDEQGRPYIFDENLGYMVFTKVTVDDLTHEMWLPVMNGANKAMKKEGYTYKDRYGKEKTVDPATMFDINTAIMRCLTKNLAMFGLGLYIYAGEDLPEEEKESASTAQKPSKAPAKGKSPAPRNYKSITKEQATELLELAKTYSGKGDDTEAWLCKQAKVQFVTDISEETFATWMEYMNKEIEAGRDAS